MLTFEMTNFTFKFRFSYLRVTAFFPYQDNTTKIIKIAAIIVTKKTSKWHEITKQNYYFRSIMIGTFK